MPLTYAVVCGDRGYRYSDYSETSIVVLSHVCGLQLGSFEVGHARSDSFGCELVSLGLVFDMGMLQNPKTKMCLSLSPGTDPEKS